jgi:hypothetical protein
VMRFATMVDSPETQVRCGGEMTVECLGLGCRRGALPPWVPILMANPKEGHDRPR